ncbi:unnamed protein product [Rotaria sp. Silwood2]|nr:unnamed protein product [Rotaria sp. Silwood2]CAF3090143.1 unnamed protein product [Rotaria sp. Silwood2]CAF3347526.1 unnamed protein product [Rotaria sp. Silwood2]CAF3442252.1 unnamed protein product [Rotaria sp. Silwood2]CAF4619434.1 unnamed protein product [Rotaria sp. Silwood2]
MRRNARQRQLNNNLSVLPIFTPLNHYKIYHINELTTTMLLHALIAFAKKTANYTIDTEDDYFTNERVLIQIELI